VRRRVDKYQRFVFLINVNPISRYGGMLEQWPGVDMRIEFLGGIGGSTGSKTLLEHGGRRLLVDCGLFQGLKQLRLRNWEALPVAPSSIDAVLLTNANLDRSGFIPRLIKLGFAGPIYCTAGTRKLCEVLLPEAGRLQEEDAEFANRTGCSRHKPALPLYTESEARQALTRFEEIPFGQQRPLWPGWTVELRRSGHILGSCGARVAVEGKSVLFSGELGDDCDLVMRPPEPPAHADCLIVEASYCDRPRRAADVLTTIAEVIGTTAARGGVVVVPAMCIGRTQTLLDCIAFLKNARNIPDLPVYVDSPISADISAIYQSHSDEHHLNAQQCERLAQVATWTRTLEESALLGALKGPAVIVAGNEMATGGRVLRHLKTYAPDARNAVLLLGLQVPGTRGAALAAGLSPIQIHGAPVTVRAQVHNVDALSAQADNQQWLDWISKLERPPHRIFITHGSPHAIDALSCRVTQVLGWECSAPEYRQEVEL
jgi:metallo-beta-lactamase family protein